MNVMVSARVPVELRDQVARRLKESGASTTQLINAAYADYARTGVFPGKQRDTVSIGGGRRALNAKQRQALARSIDESTITISIGRGVNAPATPEDDARTLAQGKLDDYEALA